jgi:hypothetical protein
MHSRSTGQRDKVPRLEMGQPGAIDASIGAVEANTEKLTLAAACPPAGRRKKTGQHHRHGN